jgi:acyl-CoA synthetase (AMP-forming)/AMP-acid ligase II
VQGYSLPNIGEGYGMTEMSPSSTGSQDDPKSNEQAISKYITYQRTVQH